MLTGLRHGLPQLILTHLFDEAANAYQLTTTGAAHTHPATTTNPTDLITSGHQLLDNPTHHHAAKHLQHQINHQPTPADLVSTLTAIAEENRCL